MNIDRYKGVLGSLFACGRRFSSISALCEHYIWDIIRIYQECEDRIEKSVPRIAVRWPAGIWILI